MEFVSMSKNALKEYTLQTIKYKNTPEILLVQYYPFKGNPGKVSRKVLPGVWLNILDCRLIIESKSVVVGVIIIRQKRAT